MSEPVPLPAWARVWREGIAPQLTGEQLRVLHTALSQDDPQLVQGCTVLQTHPGIRPSGEIVGACGMAYCLWKTGNHDPLKLDRAFERLCSKADLPNLSHQEFIRFFDYTPRPQMIAQLLPEVALALEGC